jgi:intracellular sulfur oxidation DsrE/DsrF family protein
MPSKLLTAVVCLAMSVMAVSGAQVPGWPAPKAPAIPEADGYVAIPGAAMAPSAAVTYRAVLDATRNGRTPATLVPAVNAAGGILNDLVAAGVPATNARLAVVFHGAALDGILNDASFRAKFKAANPNLKVLAALKKMGVELFVCGQNLAADHNDPKLLSPDVTVASDAFLVLISYQNRGYALMPF